MEHREEAPPDLVDVASAATTDDRRQCRSRLGRFEGSLQVESRFVRLLSRRVSTRATQMTQLVVVASEDGRKCSDRLGLREGTPQDLGDVASSVAAGERRQSSSRLEHHEGSPQDIIRPVPHERRSKIGGNVIDLHDASNRFW